MAGSNLYLSFLSWETLCCALLTLYYIIEAPFVNLFKKPKNLKGTTALVTGSGRGLGKEITTRLANEGCQLICVDVDSENLKKTVEEINEKHGEGKAISFVVNVADKEEVYKLAENLAKIGRQVDILVNNAGIVKAAPLLEESDEIIQKVLNVNLIAHFWTVKAFLPDMIKRNEGHIVAISSMIAFTSTANTVVYAASKYGVTGFMYSLREELRAMKQGSNIKTTAVHPFFLDSKPYNVEHWKVESKLPDLNISTVAKYVVKGIKYDEDIVSIPPVLYWFMHLFRFLPTKARDMWYDAFYANVDDV